MGRREVTNGVVGGYTWLSYADANTRVKNIASGLSRLTGGLKKDTPVGLFSINRTEWVLAEHACFHQSYITVPLYDTLGTNEYSIF